MAAVGNAAVSPAVTALQRIEVALHPARVDAVVSAASDEDLPLIWAQSRALGRLAWVAMAIVVGHALDRTDESEAIRLPNVDPHLRATTSLVSKALGIHKSEVSRASKIYRRIIRPRIEALGEEATFTIDGRTYYEIAIEASDFSERPAMELIEIAEDALAAGSYSTRRYRQDLIDRGFLPVDEDEDEPLGASVSLDRRAEQLFAILQKLSRIEDDVVAHAAHRYHTHAKFREVATDAELAIASLQRRVESLAAEAPASVPNSGGQPDGIDEEGDAREVE